MDLIKEKLIFKAGWKAEKQPGTERPSTECSRGKELHEHVEAGMVWYGRWVESFLGKNTSALLVPVVSLT